MIKLIYSSINNYNVNADKLLHYNKCYFKANF